MFVIVQTIYDLDEPVETTLLDSIYESYDDAANNVKQLMLDESENHQEDEIIVNLIPDANCSAYIADRLGCKIISLSIMELKRPSIEL